MSDTCRRVASGGTTAAVFSLGSCGKAMVALFAYKNVRDTGSFCSKTNAILQLEKDP
jgi:hypothetical protein